MRVVFAHIKKYKVLEDVVVNIDSAFSYEMLPSGEIKKRTKNIPENFFADNISMHCIIGKNGSGKSLLMSLLLGGEDRVDAGESYTLLYESEEGLLLKRGSADGITYHLCEQEAEGLLKARLDDAFEIYDKHYWSYYLSSNNINLLKSEQPNRWNDLSIGNDKRFQGLHNTFEVNHYNMLKRGNTSLTRDLLNRIVRLRIDYAWIRTHKVIESVAQRFRMKEIKEMVRSGNVAGVFCQVFLRAFDKNFTINELKGFTEENFNSSYYGSDLYAILRLCLFDLGLVEDLNVSRQQDVFLHALFDELEERVVFHEEYLEIISTRTNDLLIRVFSSLAIGSGIRSDHYKFLIDPPFSTGQWKRVELASKLNLLKSSKKNTIVNIFLDEPDADLHPELQTELISWIIDELKTSEKQFNIVISTHNPLILSDFPAEAITSLSPPGEADVSQTFGANIYELYKKTFLVENAMGKFAADKIRQALVSKKPDVALLTFLRDEIAEPLIVREINTVLASLLQRSAENDRLDDFFNALTPEQRLRLRDWMNNHDS